MAKIDISNLYLNYPIYNFYEKNFRKKIFNLIRKKKSYEPIEALKNINLQINDGESVGFIGHNGSGKTSLIKIISKIYPPSKGKIEVDGNVNSLIDINFGSLKDATGYENIKLMLYARGIKTDTIEENVKWISEFSGLHDALERPLRTYSSGMSLRLAAAVVLSIKSEIFITDEFFGVGDKNFISKVGNHIKELQKQSKIFIIATHNEQLISELCNRVITFENGNIVKDQMI